MLQDDYDTPVIFRKDRKRNPEITAVFPCEPYDYDGRHMTCYVHVGQHGACSMAWYYGSRVAKPSEYADLLCELISLGYRPKIYKRMTHKLRAQFNSAVKRLRQVRP